MVVRVKKTPVNMPGAKAEVPQSIIDAGSFGVFLIATSNNAVKNMENLITDILETRAITMEFNIVKISKQGYCISGIGSSAEIYSTFFEKKERITRAGYVNKDFGETFAAEGVKVSIIALCDAEHGIYADYLNGEQQDSCYFPSKDCQKFVNKIATVPEPKTVTISEEEYRMLLECKRKCDILEKTILS